MKTRMLPAALLLGLMGMGSCGGEAPDPAGTVTVTIESSDWNGWVEDHESSVVTETHVADEGESFDFKRGFIETTTATVEVIEDDHIVLSFNQGFAPRGDGTASWQHRATTRELHMSCRLRLAERFSALNVQPWIAVPGPRPAVDEGRRQSWRHRR